MLQRPSSLVVTLCILLTLWLPRPTDACGPYPFDTRFWYDDRPGVAQHRALRGELGVFEPQFDTVWIFAAWRQLAGPGLVEADREKLVWLLMSEESAEADGEDGTGEPTGTRAWDVARKSVTGEGAGWLDTTRETSAADGEQRSWAWFDNCLDDAFETAAETLRARAADYGADHPAVREWIRGQDAVFANCSGGSEDPAALPSGEANEWPEWLQEDRAYQFAAAALYSERYDQAAERFGAISRNAGSPWQTVSGYLVGRALARAGRHDEAIETYRTVLANPEAAELHASARGLIDHLRFRHEPGALRKDIVSRLSASPLPYESSESLQNDLTDFYRLSRGSFENEDTEPLTDWFRAVKGWTAPQDVVERWRRERGGPQETAWRWAALLRANTTEIVFDDGREYSALPNDTIRELLGASTLEPGATGAVSEAYHRARLLLDTGRSEEAIPILEAGIGGEYGSVATADTNLFLAQRLRAARSLEEVLRFGQMYPTEVGWNYDDNEPLAGYDGELSTWQGGPLWHMTAARLLNGLSPSALASQLLAPQALNSEGGAHSVADPLLRAESLRVAWTRAVALEDGGMIVELARRLSEADAKLAPQLEPVLSAPGVERSFVAALVVLRNPGLHPDFHWGVPRPTDIDELDAYTSDWWCEGETFLLPEAAELDSAGAATPENLDALSRLGKLPTAPIWLGHQVLSFADAHPDDSRVPEALHRVVRATRHGCQWGTEGFGEVSKAAFRRLHERYPGNEWTEKTPYWFD